MISNLKKYLLLGRKNEIVTVTRICKVKDVWDSIPNVRILMSILRFH
jgi:hypothetical protein